MPGSFAANYKEGSRSEILADYLFSQWGAVTPVRRQDDVGVDLYCALCYVVGKRAVVSDYFAVQVKSDTGPWIFENQEAVTWLVKYPTPLFLACVDKKRGSVSVYHVMPRFHVWAFGKLPSRLELKPEERDDGEFISWENGEVFSLSAPIMRATIADLIDGDKMEALRKVFQSWVQFDGENCDLVRQGLPRFRIPASYRVNELPKKGISQLGYASEEMEYLERGILRLTESAECIGGQLFRLGDRSGAVYAALLVRHLLKRYESAFAGKLQGVVGLGDLVFMSKRLNDALEALQNGRVVRYAYMGIDEIGKALENDPIVKRFLANNE